MKDFFSNLINKFQSLSDTAKRRFSVIGYSFVLVVVLLVLALSYSSPSGVSPAGNIYASPDKDGETSTTAPPTTNAYIAVADEANLAFAVAANANLSVVNSVMERASTIAIRSRMSQAEDGVITKPIVPGDGINNAIVDYVTIDGDTVPILADRFGITAQTIKWANNLTSDNLGVGTTLAIPVVDGVVYTVKQGDTLASIVDKYGSSESQILAINDIDSITVGERIVIPGGILPANERPGYVAPNTVFSGGFGWYGNTAYVGNRYAYGYCTWYAYNRRMELGGRQIGSFWGNATSWASAAISQGFTVSYTPIAGSIFQISGGWGGAGHVGIVEAVSADGTMIKYSDMNGRAGWNRVYWSDWTPLPAGWRYIW